MALCSGNAALREWPIDGSTLAVDNRLKRRAHRIALPPPDPLESIVHSRVGIPSWTIANLREGKQAVVDLAGSDQVRTPHGFGQGDVQVCSDAPPCWRACAERVRRKLAEDRALPDARGRQLRSGRTQTIGVLLPHLDQPYFLKLLAGIEERLDQSDYMVLLGSAHWKHEGRQVALLERMLARRVWTRW